jgi:hypothetical protein
VKNSPKYFLSVLLALGVASAAAADLNQAAREYLAMLENFAGFAEQHWNEPARSYDAKGKGVTWARGNGGVTLVNALLLTTSFCRTACASIRRFSRAAHRGQWEATRTAFGSANGASTATPTAD